MKDFQKTKEDQGGRPGRLRGFGPAKETSCSWLSCYKLTEGKLRELSTYFSDSQHPDPSCPGTPWDSSSRIPPARGLQVNGAAPDTDSASPMGTSKSLGELSLNSCFLGEMTA